MEGNRSVLPAQQVHLMIESKLRRPFTAQGACELSFERIPPVRGQPLSAASIMQAGRQVDPWTGPLSTMLSSVKIAKADRFYYGENDHQELGTCVSMCVTLVMVCVDVLMNVGMCVGWRTSSTPLQRPMCRVTPHSRLKRELVCDIR